MSLEKNIARIILAYAASNTLIELADEASDLKCDLEEMLDDTKYMKIMIKEHNIKKCEGCYDYEPLHITGYCQNCVNNGKGPVKRL